MAQYILLIHGNVKNPVPEGEWDQFFEAARESGLFRGGSEIGQRILIGDSESVSSTDHIAGYMRFDCENRQEILDLLELHPVVVHGGTVELCELPES